MRKLIVTDLTRFNSGDDVCMAGTDMDSGECVRPMPYLTGSLCAKMGILPGAILKGDFVRKAGCQGPHQEDASYNTARLSFEGPSTASEFKKALLAGLHASVEEGFEIKLVGGQKYVPPDHPIERSIITVAVDPSSLEIVEDTFKPGKTKVHFSDSAGRGFSFLPITDLGFHRYADSHRESDGLEPVNDLIRAQKEVFLRVGLSRPWKNPMGINGCWMQVNGIYTFPDFFRPIRSYK